MVERRKKYKADHVNINIKKIDKNHKCVKQKYPSVVKKGNQTITKKKENGIYLN